MKKDRIEKTESATVDNMPVVVEKKPVKILKKILNIVVNILIVLVLIVSILIAVMALTSKANDGISSIFGFTIQSIQSPSMEGGNKYFEGGDFKKGDLIIGKDTSHDFERIYDVGDIVTYVNYEFDAAGNKQRVLICHRIIEVYEFGGEYAYRTMGDNNGKADQEEGDYAQYLRRDQIGAVFYTKDFHGVKIPGLGSVIDFIQTQKGFFFCILLPMIIFFLFALVRVIINVKNYNKNKIKEDKEEAEEEKQKAIDEAVAAALAEKDKESAGVSPENMTPEQMEQFKQFLAQQEAQKADAQAEEASQDAPADELPEE